MNDDYTDRMVEVLIDNSDNELFEFMKDNIDKLRDYSKTLADELSKVPLIEYKYTDYYSFNDTILLVKEFLGTIDKSFPDKLEKVIVDGNIRIEKKDENDTGSYVEWNDVEGKTRLDFKIEPTYSIEDAFSLVHEFIHITNASESPSRDRRLLSEAISSLFELLLYDYLKEKNVNRMDLAVSVIENVNFAIERCDSLNDGLYLLENTLNKPNISRLDEYRSDEFYDEVDEVEKTLLKDVKYSLANIVSIILFYGYKKGKISIDQIKSINSEINNSENMEIFKYIMMEEPSLDDVKESCEYLKEDIDTLFRTKKL